MRRDRNSLSLGAMDKTPLMAKAFVVVATCKRERKNVGTVEGIFPISRKFNVRAAADQYMELAREQYPGATVRVLNTNDGLGSL